MIYRTLGRTGIEVSCVGFGGGPLQSVGFDEAEILLNASLDMGINIFDVDKIHRDNEEKLSMISGRRKEYHIATKSFSSSWEEMERDIQESVSVLKTEYIDIYQLHMVNSAEDLEERMAGALEALKDARKDGIIGFIGITGHHIPTLIKAAGTGEFDTIMVAYNTGHTLADELLDLAKNDGLGVFSMKPLGGGFLVDPKYGESTNPAVAEKMTFRNALSFSLSEKRIDCILIGMNRPEQVTELADVELEKIELPEDERRKIQKEVVSFLGNDYCRTCKYCLPCASVDGLEIDEFLRLKGFSEKYGYEEVPKRIYASKKITALACEACGSCVKRCPYNIDIPAGLKKAHEILCTDENRDVISWDIASKHDDGWKDQMVTWRCDGRNDLVIAFARENLKKYPNNISLLHNIAESLYHEDFESEGLAYMDRVHELKPDMPNVHITWGKLYYEKGKFDEAIKSLKKHLAGKPGKKSVLEANYYLALCYKQKVFKG